MASQAARTSARNKASDKIAALEVECSKATSTQRALETKIKNAKDLFEKAEEAHYTAFDEEEAEDRKETMTMENNAMNDRFYDIMETAQDRLDAIIAAKEPQPMPVRDSLELAKSRSQASIDRDKARVTLLLDEFRALESVNQAQIDHLSGKLEKLRASARAAAESEFNVSYRPNLSAATTLALDKQFEAMIKPLTDAIDAMDLEMMKKIPNPNPQDAPRNENDLSLITQHSTAASNVSTRLAYQKMPIPKFSGALRQFPRWKLEFQESVLPGRDPQTQLRLLNQHTPDEIDLLNCVSVDEAWDLLNAKYGNSTLISQLLIKDFTARGLVGKTPESQIVNLRDTVTRLHTDLQAVGAEDRLTDNAWLLDHIMEQVPVSFRHEFRKIKTQMMLEEGGSRWRCMFRFIKELSAEIESEMPSRLDETSAKRLDAAPRSDVRHPSHLIDISKLPPRIQKTVNAALAKTTGDAEEEGSVDGAAANVANSTTSHKKLSKQHGTPIKSPKYDEAAAKNPCPLCGEVHNFVTANNLLIVSTSFAKCDTFKALTSEQKARTLEEHRACAACLQWTHSRETCNRNIKRCRHRGCTVLHHPDVHGTSIAYVNAAEVSAVQADIPVFTHIVEVKLADREEKWLALLDDGSNSSFVLQDAAEEQKYRGRKELISVQTAGNTRPEPSTYSRYSIPVLHDGIRVTLDCIALPTITSNQTGHVNVEEAYNLFPHVPSGALDRPQGKIQMLIGQDYAGLLAYGGGGKDRVNNLRAMKTGFGTGWVLGGTHPALNAPSVEMDPETEALKTANLVMAQPASVSACHRLMPELIDLPHELPRTCMRCKNCQNCRFEVQEITRKEREELAAIRKAVCLDKDRKICTATYPLIKQPTDLIYNEWQAKALAISQMKTLKKNGLLSEYQAEIDDYIFRGVITPVSHQQINTHRASGGAVAFVGHHAVRRLDHATTKTRVVTNSSLPIGGKGNLSSNDHWAKGPNTLKPLGEMLLRFRLFPVALHFDISKMYHAVETGPDEMFLRLMIWFDKDIPTIYGPQRVLYGDRPATAILETCKDLAADAGQKIDAKAAQVIRENTYVDDACAGGSEEEVATMIGKETVLPDGKLHYSGTIPKILEQAGFKVKMMIRSGEGNSPAALEKMGQHILGHEWDPYMDTFAFKVEFATDKRGKDGLHAGPVISHQVGLVECITWTRRKILSAVASLYDPLGMISPITIRLRIFLRAQLQEAGKIRWDDPLKPEMTDTWKKTMSIMIVDDVPTFPRRAAPLLHRGPPTLVAFSDGSNMAYCSAVYARWKVDVAQPGPWEEGLGTVTTFKSYLLCSKSRVTPLKGLSVPRSEINALLLSHRLINTCLRAMTVKPSDVWFLVDSSCVTAVLSADHGKLAPYMANRRAQMEELREDWTEMYKKIKIHAPVHVAGHRNIADLGTRDLATPKDVGMNSEWQSGPTFLALDPIHWPITQNASVKIPDEDLLPKHRVANLVQTITPHPLLKSLREILDRTNSYQKALNVIARILKASSAAKQDVQQHKQRSKLQRVEFLRQVMLQPLTAEDMNASRRVTFLLYQSEVDYMLAQPGHSPNKPGQRLPKTNKPQRHFQLSSLSPFKEDRIWYTQGRYGANLGKVLGPKKLPILPATCRLAFLIMNYAHQQAHRGASDTCLRSRCLAWIVRARPLADRVTDECRKCPIIWKTPEQQKMANLPDERLQVREPPFTASALDFFGPYTVRDGIKGRSSRKVWPLIIGCLNTGALHCEVAMDYSTSQFLMAFSRFASVRGMPSMIYTDRGAQLVRAAGTVTNQAEWSWDQVINATSTTTSWRFTTAGSQWRNGLAEARVRSMKEALDMIMPPGAHNLTTPEFETLIKKCTNIINDRPLGVKRVGSTTDGEILPITPNHLLLGRTSLQPPASFVPPGTEDRLSLRVQFVEELENLWWQIWFAQVFADLLPRGKWKEESYNLRPGDICLKAPFKQMGKGKYQICRVIEVHPDETGLVRTVTISSRPHNSREKTLPYISKNLVTEKISVQRLVLLCSENDIITSATPKPLPQRQR